MSFRDKIIGLDRLPKLCRRTAIGPARIVLCCGVFDLFHHGHLLHLEAARREGNILVVAVTADRHVRKGPGHPINNQFWRAEMIASKNFVDWVIINDSPTAEPVIHALKPDVYAKGADYENPDDDITGKIDVEREAVERHNGCVVFTKELSLSSSALINKYFNIYDPPLQDLIDRFHQEGLPSQIFALIEAIKGFRVVLVGETILDEYRYVEPLGKPSKENIIAVRARNGETFAGGVIAAANHLASFVQHVDVITVMGDNTPLYDRALIHSSARANVKIHAVRPPVHSVIRKVRYVEPQPTRKLFEVYEDGMSALPEYCEPEIVRLIHEIARDADLVTVTDYGHKVITKPVMKAIASASPYLAVNTQTNAGNQGFNRITKYLMHCGKINYICLDAPEARQAMGEQDAGIEQVISEIGYQFECDNVMVTHGHHGCVAFHQGTVWRVPAFTSTVVDTVGAGDAFLAITAPLVKAGGRMDVVGFIGNAAGALKVGIVGHRQSVDKVGLLKFLTAVLKQ